MTESELKAFIDVVVNYFREVTGETVEMGVPYIKGKRKLLLDYTGLIGISGTRKGAVYLTASSMMLREIASILLGDEEPDDDFIVDLVGEISNTIAGNVRQSFGSSFMISVPIILKGSPEDVVIKLNPPVFSIPIKWRTYQCYLVVGLE